MIAGDDVVINGDGETSRDFCFVANAVQANLLAATAPAPEARDQVYNVAVGDRTTLNDLFQELSSSLQPHGVPADTLPVAGNDLNVDGLFRNGIRGQGVVIGIVDDGLQIAHPDLAANVAAVAGKNFANGSNNPSPASSPRM